MVERLAIEGGMPTRKEFLPFGRPFIGQEERREMMDTLRSDWLSKGPKTKRFEEDFRKYVGSKYAVAVSSCTAGMHIALASAGVKEGDEIITSPLTFVATGNAILYLRATPVMVDIDKRAFNINPELLEEKITTKTKAIIPVHFAGHPCNMDEIVKIAGKHNLTVIEDAAHAIGAEYKGRKVGSIGDAAAFSFYAIKNITTGDGGMVTTDDKKMAKNMEVLSFHGLSTDAWERYSPSGKVSWEMTELGYKYNMTDIQASLGIHQLKKLDKFIDIRTKYAKLYDNSFSEMPELSIQHTESTVRHAKHLYPIILRLEMLKTNRDGFVNAMKAENIGCGIHFIALHMHDYYKRNFNIKRKALPNASYISDRIVSLPLYPRMTKSDIADVVRGVKKVISHYRK